jgi:NAD-dependent DNA ligase
MGDMADMIEWFGEWPDDPICPECGNELERREDQEGVTYQCGNMSCLSFFTEEEILG